MSPLSRTSLAFGCICLLNVISLLPWDRIRNSYYSVAPGLADVYGEVTPYEGVSPVWNIGPLRQVAMYFEPTVHYQLNSTEADAEWAALTPLNGGIVYAGSERKPYLLSIFHQLRCLDVLRRAYISLRPADAPGNSTALHCFNYIRQMVLCRSDTVLEPVWDTEGPHAVQPWRTLTCKDWHRVYEAHAQNMHNHSEPA
ncbi:hypothetical protein BV20DRAFT_1112525 [Pilatotrama ljubarskyi]|nr:hypothetical protein BV20DRAFT_1112525 [Pilatotrama ljubarskyi]